MALIALDTLVNALCVCMALRLMGRRIRPGRALASALLGAGIAAWLRSGAVGLHRTLLWLPAAYLMAGAAGCGWRVRGALVLLGAYGLVGGTVGALAGAAGSLAAGWLAGAAALGPMALAILRARRASQDVHRARVTICVKGRSASFDAIIDSGNSLRDYLTHRPVIVLPGSAADALGLRGAPLRPIFADTAGGRQMMDCFTPERVTLQCAGGRRRVAACAAISGALADGAPALVPQALLDREWNGEDMRAYGADKEGDAYGETEG